MLSQLGQRLVLVSVLGEIGRLQRIVAVVIKLSRLHFTGLELSPFGVTVARCADRIPHDFWPLAAGIIRTRRLSEGEVFALGVLITQQRYQRNTFDFTRRL